MVLSRHFPITKHSPFKYFKTPPKSSAWWLCCMYGFVTFPNDGFVRCLPVHARCSERRFVLDLPFVDHAAKV